MKRTVIAISAGLATIALSGVLLGIYVIFQIKNENPNLFPGPDKYVLMAAVFLVPFLGGLVTCVVAKKRLLLHIAVLAVVILGVEFAGEAIRGGDYFFGIIPRFMTAMIGLSLALPVGYFLNKRTSSTTDICKEISA